MAETKFTPGPWLNQGDDEDAGGLPVILIEGSDYAICNVLANDEDASDDGYAIGKKTQANANLIAAAPELYEALDAFVGAVSDERLDGMIERLRAAKKIGIAALAKARRET